MEIPESQAQDTLVVNGAAEASTSSFPPQAVLPALSDLSTTAEQGKDASTTVVSSSTVPPKKFSAVKISKSFMEQSSSAPGAGQTLSSSQSSKITSTTAKSPPPTATSHHPRLVTKLTKLPSSSAGPSPGWTRPSSTAPSLAPSPVSGGVSVGPSPAPAPASHGPQLPLVGKVIQPQPRGAIQTPSTSKSETANGSSKPAWRNVRQGGSTTGVGPIPGAQSEFPTAAEVALGHLNGVQDKKQSTQAPAAPSPATTEADTFRGVHLNPNAHHWDEMEEDNDDFLGGVIEFGDGRSYQIQPVDAPQTTQDSSPTLVPAPEASTDPHSPSAPTGINKEDRFSDDYDRSWPRSAALSSNIRPRVGPPPGASTSSNSSLSPQEASRVLFNERSNRREPWMSNNRNAPPDGRLGKDPSLHNNVQLLQKHGHDRSREVRRDSSSQGPEDQRWERGRRASNATTTHSAISGGRDSSRESLRQLPPHLASNSKPLPPSQTHQLPHLLPPSGRHGSTREPWRSGRSPEQSPVISSPLDTSSHVTPSSASDVVATSPQTAIPADFEMARKAAMHSAAERARTRRQQDEEERERERERARKKAAEVELKENTKSEKSRTHELPVVQETQQEPTSPRSPTAPAPDRQSFIRPPPSRQPSRGPDNGPASPTTGIRTQRDAQSAKQPPSVSSTVTSWRSNAAPLSPVSPRRTSHLPVTPAVTFPSAFQVLGAQLLNSSNDESLEEVEFTDLGKFVGVEPKPDEAVAPGSVQHIDVSTEDDQSPPTRTRSDLDPSWRRKTSLAPVKEQPSVIANTVPDAVSESLAIRETHTIPASPSVPTTSIGTGFPARPTDGSFPGHTLPVPSSLPSQRSPRAPSISAIDDTISRIKGAMQTESHRSAHHTDRAAVNSTVHSAEQPRFGRGVTQTSRSHPPRVPEPDELFTTLTELHNDIQSGQPSRVRLPSSRSYEPLSKRELVNPKTSIPPLQWEVLSWDPPVEGMSIRDYSINSVLFQKPLTQKGHPRYRVSLPPSGSYLVRRSSPANPKVHLPAKPLVNKTLTAGGAFGRPRVADENSNWRRTLPSIPDQVESTASSEGLVTRSGSSPPDTDKASDVTPSHEAETILPVQLSTKSRAEPKMPAGTSVAFYRESTSCPSVSFTVSSELEDARQSEKPMPSLPTEEHAPVSPLLGNSQGNEVDGASTLPAPREMAESKSSDGSSDTPLTPPSSTGWTKSLVKESPVRQPDPEQLKLLWSQTSEKAGIPGVNSLEGITDDLPSVPFSLQEVKSEDGETPPPTGSNGGGPSRMSLHDVTRAFQQVPPPPAGSIASKGSPQSPAVSTTTSGSGRHPPFPSHAQAMHSTVGGPTYPPYASPMLSHSPAPTLLYPHPMAANPMMGGSSPQYPQPMWIPMAPAGPGGQTPGPLRAMHSPYPTHPSYMSYPSPGAYGAPQLGPPPPGPPNGAQNRPRPPAASGLSPNMSHSRAPAPVPMYHQSSPVLVHPQVMHVQPSYPGMPVGRGVPMQASHPTPNPHAGGYTPTTHGSYMRPPWHAPVN